ncbi:hypothetical protein FCV76_23170, partial [Vibrio sp. F13]
NEGDNGVDEAGHWAAYREGILVAEGDFIASDLADGNNNSGYLNIGPDDTGFKAFDELQFTAVGPAFDKNGDANADSSDYYVTSVTTDGLTGDGTDILRGGRGDDVILGGDNAKGGIPELDPETGYYDVSSFRGTIDVTMEGTEAGFENSFGYFTKDSEGNVNAEVIWGNVKDHLPNSEAGNSFSLDLGHC